MLAWMRLSLRLTGFLAALAITTGVAVTLAIISRVARVPVSRPLWAARCFRLLSACLGWKIHAYGQPASKGAVLLAANHISWVDIPVLGILTGARFLSKSEVSRWPLIGWLAREGGTLFIQRGGGQTGNIRREMAAHLKQAEPVLIFPEGTTSCGLTVLPIYGRLLNAARDASAAIQPVSIGYRRNGRPDELAPFIGDDTFLRHLVRLLKQPPVCVEVIFHTPVPVDCHTPARALAAQIHQALNAGLADIHARRLVSSNLPAGPGGIRTAADPG